MPRPLRVLIVEDSADDAELLGLELRRGGLDYELERVDTPETMAEALQRDDWDIVIADYKIPGFGGLSALRMMQERRIDLPFIVVSGTIGEETAVEAMKAGAHDYVLKQNLARLSPAVRRELREAQMRREGRGAAAALQMLARRSAFLADVSRRLAASLNYEETLNHAARLALGEVADWCVLSVVDAGSVTLRTVISHSNPASEAQARAHLERCAPVPAIERDMVELIRAGQRTWTTADDVLSTALARSHAKALVPALGYDSGLRLPLTVGQRTIGALTLVRTGEEGRLTQEDLDFAEEIADRAAIALDNAALYKQARDAIRIRDEFLSIASHELNTPLATLILELDDLIDDGSTRIVSGLARARRQVARLSRLVENLLDVSRIAASRLELRLADIDLVAVVREVVEQFQPELSRSHCVLTFRTASTTLVGRWDPMRIAQVVTNLLSNACKYGPGKPIDISVEGDVEMARLLVRDRGIGIAPNDIKRIFGRFERSVSARHYAGLGLGLYITRQVVEAHGGIIRVESLAGVGSTFSVELPRATSGRKRKEEMHVDYERRPANSDC